MSDYSEAEVAALKTTFPGVRVYTYVTSIGSSCGHAGLKTTSRSRKPSHPSEVWTSDISVGQRLSTMWLNIPQVL